MAKCFACDRRLAYRKGGKPYKHAYTRDGQIVFVGEDCWKLIVKAGEAGYQPPKGGPRLYALPLPEQSELEHSMPEYWQR